MTEHSGNADLEGLRAEVAALRAELATLRAEPVERPMSRRGLLLGGAAAAAAAVIGTDVVKAAPAAATTGTMRYGYVNNAGSTYTELHSSSVWTLFVQNSADGPALSAKGYNGPGVKAAATYGNALEAVVDIATNGFNGVYGATNGTGNGVFGEALATDASANAVLGIAKGSGNSVFGFKDTNVPGDAVVGLTKGTGGGVVGISSLGRGGAFAGKAAQVQLTPSSAATHPTNGQAGDLFVDAGKRLWFCKGGASWKQLA